VFAYDDAVTERYPTIRAGVIHTTGLTNGPSSAKLLDEYQAAQQAAVGRLHTNAIADLPSIAAWRRAFSRFGAKPTQHRNAAEALLRRLAKHGDIPTVNALVDIGNLVSIRHALPVAVFDLAGVAGAITVRFATGDELFTDLGSTGSVSPDPGEVIFVDGNNVVTARRWCWRQSAQSATSATTVDALVVIEGHHDTAGKDVEAALTDLISLLAAHQPDSQTTPYVLSATNPQVRSRGGNVHPGVPRTVTRTTPSWSPILTVEGS
jgi:DNA/RNA-binding domain of Phe-tRNA-synthetase-like protein